MPPKKFYPFLQPYTVDFQKLQQSEKLRHKSPNTVFCPNFLIIKLTRCFFVATFIGAKNRRFLRKVKVYGGAEGLL